MAYGHRFILLILAAVAACAAPAEPPRLVVQIVVDGLPTETALLHADRLRPGGMGRFFREGAVYTGAELPYLTTFTAVGHASLFTGTVPAFHGIIGNEWINSETGAEVYCVEDPSHSLLDFPSKPREGMSPANLESPTVGDELVRATGGAARVYSVSGKDRGAILPGGRMGKAFWYAKQAGTFATSTYYYPETPAWLREWRGAHHAGNHQDAVWGLLRPAEDYLRRDADDRPTEKGLGPVFPHDLGGLEGDALAEAVR